MADDFETARILFNKATEFRFAGKTAEAVAAFDEVIQQFGNSSKIDVLTLAAKAEYNKGIALRDGNHAQAARQAFTAMVESFGNSPIFEIRKRVAAALLSRAVMEPPEKALATFNDFLMRFANAPETDWQPDIAVALTSKGVLLADAHRYEEAVVVFDSVLRRFTGSETGVREQIARALYFKGSILMTYESIAATEAFEDLIRRFENEASPAIAQVVQQGRLSLERLHAAPPKPDSELRKILLQINYRSYKFPANIDDVPAPAGHALSDPFEAAIGQELTPEYQELHNRLVAERLRDARQLHVMASAFLSQCREQKRPFCLYLRNFDLEAYTRPGKEPDGQEQLINMSLGNQDPTERKIAAALTFRMPVIGIQNPAINRPDFRHAIPKLELPNETWRETLSGMVRDAAFVVMHLETLTPGVSSELDLLQQLGKNNQTVVLLSPDNQPDPLISALSMFYSLPAKADLVEKSDPRLVQFHRVLNVDEVPFELLDLSPAFRDLLGPE